MSAAPLTDRRTIRAAGIVERQEVQLSQPGLWRVRDTQTGSGTWHIVTKTACDCIDFARNGLACKHMIAAANWSTRQPSGPTCRTCGAATQAEQFYIGGRGYCTFRICKGNREHRAVRL